MYLQELQRTLSEAGIDFSPLDFQLDEERGWSRNGTEARFYMQWEGERYLFATAIKLDLDSRRLDGVIEQLKYEARGEGVLPLIVTRYLTRSKLAALEKRGVSALDLCGNGVITVPGRLYVRRDGCANKFRRPRQNRLAYAGDSSLVSRALLLQNRFDSLKSLQSFIRMNGGVLAQGTISKAVACLEKDLIVEKNKGVGLLDPDLLLMKLAEAYREPKVYTAWLGKVSLSLDRIPDALKRIQDVEKGVIVRSGASSVSSYATFAGEPKLTCYCNMSLDRVLDLLAEFGIETREGKSFANLELIQTADQAPFFDRRENLNASPIQSWLELINGDKRQKDAAIQVREQIAYEWGNGRG